MCIRLMFSPSDLASLYTCQSWILDRHWSFSSFSLKMAIQFYACNWVPSRVTEEQLNGCVATGALAKKEVIHWRAPGPENPPEPKDGEVIVFVDHLGRGFSPPRSKNFRDVLASFQLHLKILDLTLCPIFVIFKYAAKLICKKNPLLSCLGISSIWTAVQNL